MKYIITTILMVLFLVGCTGRPLTSDEKANDIQERLANQAVDAVGLPAITKFTEKRTMKSILELRDKEVTTYTYITDLQGHLHLLCHSVGFGLPYATQFTNPMKKLSGQYGNVTVPQADPNGLFSPASADGTWVMCLNPETNQAAPLYVEPRIIVSPFELNP